MSDASPHQWRLASVALGLGLLLLALFFPFWSTSDGVLFSGGSDFFATHLAARLLLADSLRHYGTLPTWSPFWFGGAPLTGEWSNGWTYPPNWLHALFAPDFQARFYGFQIMAHLWLGGVGMAWFLRREGRSRAASALGGVAFMIHGKWLAYALLAQHPVLAWGWLPWILGFSSRLEQGDRRDLLGLGACLCLFALGLNPTYLFVSAYFLLAWFAHLLLRSTRRRRLAGLLAVAVTWSLLAAAVSLLPARQYAANGTRAGGLTLAQITATELSPLSVAASTLVPLQRTGRGMLDWEANLYCGAGVVCLALLGWRAQGRCRFFLLTAAVAAVLSTGTFTPLYGWGYSLLPGWNLFRIPPRWGMLLGLALAYLAASGLDHLSRNRSEGRTPRLWLSLLLLTVVSALAVRAQLKFHSPLPWLAPAAVVLLLACLHAFGRRAAWLAVALVTLELGSGAWRDLEVRPWSAIFPPNPLLARLSGWPDGGRTLNSQPVQLDLVQAQQSGIEPLNGVSATIPISTWRWAQQGLAGLPFELQLTFSLPEFEPRLPAFLNRAHVSHLISNHPWPQLESWNPVVQPPFATFSETSPSGYLMTDPCVVYRNPRPLPRHRLVGRGVACSSQQEAFERAGRSDPAVELMVEHENAPSGTALAGSASSQVGVQWLSFSRRRLRFHVSSPQGNYLSVSEFFYPGWQATESGRAVPLWRADGAFLCAFFPAGDHEVEIDYQPAAYLWGKALSTLAWALWLAAALWLAFTSRRTRNHQPAGVPLAAATSGV